MKTAIVTFVRAYNYGAVLQCYALSKTLSELGHSVEVIDYYPRYFKDFYNLAYLGKMRLFPYRPLRAWWQFTPVLLTIRKRDRAFDQFIRHHIPLTEKTYHSYEALCEDTLSFDMYISGSDQVWNNVCVPFDPAYFLDFPSAQGRKKCAFAASFGFSAIPEHLKEEYRRRLAGWDCYGVRESSGITILHVLLNVSAVQCCDPTLLLTKADWDAIAKKPGRRKPYILIYYVNECEKLLALAAKLAGEKNLDVVYLPCNMRHEKLMGYEAKQKDFHVLSAASPDAWLGLFAGAEYVLTDSFHGTVFSILNHKPFLTLTDFRNRRNTRALEFLEAVGLEERIVADGGIPIDQAIDWQRVDDNVQHMRQQALDYINNSLYPGDCQ